MFNSSAKKLTCSLVNNKVILEEDYEIYRFGIEMGLSMIASILTTLLIGIVFHMLMESILFLFAFIPLRSYVGGFHASDYRKCYWLSTFAVAILLFTVRFVIQIYSVFYILCIGSVCVLIMLFLVPVQDPNRPLEEVEIRIYKKRAKIVLGIESVVMLTLSLIGQEIAASVLFCTLCLMCITSCMGVIKNQIMQKQRKCLFTRYTEKV